MIRAAIILPSGADAWRVANLSLGFVGVAKQLTRSGFSVELIIPDGNQTGADALAASGAKISHLDFTLPSIVAGPGAASVTASLKLGHQLWRRLSADRPDVVVAPLAGGLLQPSLMSRSLGESLCECRFVAWGEATTAERIMLGDIEPPSVSAVIDEALETTTLRLLDAIASTRFRDPRGGGACNSIRLTLPTDDQAEPRATTADSRIDEIVYLGPASGRHGTPEFLEAIERLGGAGQLRQRKVTFLGPWREGAAGLGKAMLGRRARNWDFVFTQADQTDICSIVRYLARPGVLGVSPGAAPDDDRLIADALSAGARLAVCAHHPLSRFLRGRAWICANDLSDLDVCIDRGGARSEGSLPVDDWGSALRSVLETGNRTPVIPSARTVKATLCITHRDRPDAVAAAVASCGSAANPDLEIIVIDTGSRDHNLQRLAPLRDAGVRLLHGPPGGQQAAARNAAISKAAGDILVFLDDDNIFINNGFARLISPFRQADIDIAVSSLSLYDHLEDGRAPAADLVFLGEAGWSGLYFNGFGDANFAIRRDAFRLVGGFKENDGAAFDWVFFAKAQSAGLKIGVLQAPAIGYRRELIARDLKWRKQDQEGPRRELLRIYAQSSQIAVAALAQGARVGSIS
jgi:hypothetical protein